MNDLLHGLDEHISSKIRNLVKSSPRCVFHYTNADGLIGILSTNKIWASNLGYLNDGSEFHYARNLIVDCLNEMLKTTRPKSVLWLFENVRDRLKNFDNSHTSFFVACFCEKGDLLSQWRGYGPNGGGYAIGVYPNLIGLKPGMGDPDFDVRPVIYNKEKQISLVNELFEITEELVIKENYELKYIRDSKFADDYLGVLLDYLLMFKDPSFSEEKEWRLIMLTDIDQVRFRVQNNNVVPYVEVDLALEDDEGKVVLPVESIVVGPTNSPQRSVNSTQWVCNKYGHNDCEIRNSIIPLVD